MYVAEVSVRSRAGGEAEGERTLGVVADFGPAAALFDACADLTTRGAHLHADGDVCADAPNTPWSWEDGFAPLRKEQGEPKRKLKDASLRELLHADSRTGEARVSSCGGPGAGAR